MAPRSFWKGYLKLSLVTCPVAMTPATTESEKVSFHTLSRKTGNRVVSQYVDAVSGKPVDEDDEVKGYQRGEDEYVLLEDDELEAVGLESTRTIDINMFVDADSVGWIWYDRPHYLTPDDPVGEEAYCVIRDAMESTGTVGISRLVMYRRERAVMLEPKGKGIVLWTLRYGDEVRDPDDYFAETGDSKIDPELMNLVTRLVDERTKAWESGNGQRSRAGAASRHHCREEEGQEAAGKIRDRDGGASEQCHQHHGRFAQEHRLRGQKTEVGLTSADAGSSIALLDLPIGEAIPDERVEEPSLRKSLAKIRVGFRRHVLVIVTPSVCHEPDR